MVTIGRGRTIRTRIFGDGAGVEPGNGGDGIVAVDWDRFEIGLVFQASSVDFCGGICFEIRVCFPVTNKIERFFKIILF